MAVSNNLLAFLNFISVLCSIPIITVGIWLAAKQDHHYINWLRFPIVLFGIVILIVSLSGFIGAYRNKQSLLTFYLFSMGLLIVGLFIFLVFAFVVFSPSGAYSVPGRAFKEYRLSGFSTWMRNYVTDPDNWDRIRRSLDDSNICEHMDAKYISPSQFYASHINPIESGCCKPPTHCGYRYNTPISWKNPVNGVADPECFNWKSEPHVYCYYCESCKAGVLGIVREAWKVANVILIVVLMLLICVYLIACCACKNAQAEDLFRRLQPRWGGASY